MELYPYFFYTPSERGQGQLYLGLHIYFQVVDNVNLF